MDQMAHKGGMEYMARVWSLIVGTVSHILAAVSLGQLYEQNRALKLNEH